MGEYWHKDVDVLQTKKSDSTKIYFKKASGNQSFQPLP